jgi:hypothetical protein
MIKEFPKISAADVAFGVYPKDWFAETLKEAEKKGFGMNNSDRAAQLFYNGGKVNVKDGLDKEYVSKGLRALKAVIGSFEPPHQHKMAVCEYIIHCLEI